MNKSKRIMCIITLINGKEISIPCYAYSEERENELVLYNNLCNDGSIDRMMNFSVIIKRNIVEYRIIDYKKEALKEIEKL